MKMEIDYIKHNELLDHYSVRLRFTDPNYINGQTNEIDPEYHTICYTSFAVQNKQDIEKQIQSEAHNVWLRFHSEYLDGEITTKKEFEVDDETGELI